MRTVWLQQHRRPECIVFFTGWGMDPTPFQGLSALDHDLYMVMDYRTLETFDLDAFAGYQRLHLIAWSMGVRVAAHLLPGQAHRFATATAIGGTLTPVDGQRGIPPASYDAMLDQFSPEVLDTFYRDMFDDPGQLHRFLTHRPQRPLEELREEMAAFRDAFVDAGPGQDIYTCKIITSRDRIFSGRNQVRAWGKGCGDVQNWPHFPFYLLADWRELLVSP